MENVLTLIKSASQNLASAKQYLSEAEKHEVVSVEIQNALRKIGLEYHTASVALRRRKERFITSLCKTAYWMIGMRRYVLKHKPNSVETITLTDEESLCIHLETHPRNRCIVDHPHFLAGDDFSGAFFVFCDCLVKDVERFLKSMPGVLAWQSEEIGKLLAQVSELKVAETKH